MESPDHTDADTIDLDDRCDHCTRDAVTTENGTDLCEKHLAEYRVRNR